MCKEQRLLVEMSRHDLHAASGSQDAGECVYCVMYLHVFFSHNAMVWLLLKFHILEIIKVDDISFTSSCISHFSRI